MGARAFISLLWPLPAAVEGSRAYHYWQRRRGGGGDYRETQSEDEISIETIHSTSHDNTVVIIIIILFCWQPMEGITNK